MDGYFLGSRDWFSRSDSGVSSHFGVGLNGEIDQYVMLGDTAYANGILERGNTWPGGQHPNAETVSIETEDLMNVNWPVTEQQYVSVRALGFWIKSQAPTIKYLITHRVISPLSRVNCPGPRWVTSGRLAQLGRELNLKVLT